MASEYGAHADASGFALRTGYEAFEGDQVKQLFLYFEAPTTDTERDLIYVDALAVFMTMTRIFDPFLKQYTRDYDIDEWIKQRDARDQWIRAELGRVQKLVK